MTEECKRGGVHGWQIDSDTGGAYCWKCGEELSAEEVSARLNEALS